MRAALAAEAGVQQTLTTLTDAEVMARLGAADVCPPRALPRRRPTAGCAAAATSTCCARRTPLAEALAAAWDGRDATCRCSPADEALVLASIVEKETGKAEGGRRSPAYSCAASDSA